MGAARTVAFRLLFVYLLLYIFPFPIGIIPGTGGLEAVLVKAFNGTVPWVGAHVLGLSGPIAIHPTGSGDTLFAFVSLATCALLAVTVTAIWSLLDRRRTDHRRLDDLLRVGLRFFLMTAMVSYGFVKIWKSQFPLPVEARLDQPYGASTPMALLWTFMGASTPYTFFAGLAEALGGVLLAFRRTTTLGALVVAGVMTNVVLLNFCYDVPVKLFSAHLLFMALVLAAPDLPRLLRFFVLNRPVAPVELSPSPSRAVTRVRQIAGVVFLAGVLFIEARGAREGYSTHGDGGPPFEEYVVEEMAPPLWQRVSLRPDQFTVLTREGSYERWRLTRSDESRTFALKEVFAPAATYRLEASRPDAERLVLRGTVREQELSVTLRRSRGAPRRLLDTGFHWIQEYPNNR